MRFYSNGPIIPDILLNRRDQGRVVFLCGAGVSFNAGMPSFVGLTKHVFKFFDPPENSQLSISFKPWDEKLDGPKVPLDQIFHMLYQEYGKNDVNALVAERLQQKGATVTKSSNHKTIASISSDLEGNPQIVTTNFDRLFENVIDDSQSSIYEPPTLPDIRLGVPITGITYLHGRLKRPDANLHPYILSSADFGRAYLSEGWATTFIQSLLDRYTVVLVGYQAEDSPVKYLLQGLNHDGMSDRSKLYAFDKGEIEEIEAKWRDRGVTSIAYRNHQDLWSSLEAWAKRAEDPRKWQSKVIKMAMSGPRQVEAHERGQIAHLVRTTPGARLFDRAERSPPSEWLCVFDASCRLAKKISRNGDGGDQFDPLDAYGLDDDPKRSDISEQDITKFHDHLLEWRRGDTNPTDFHKIGGRHVVGFEAMPPRLIFLSSWIAKKLDSPVAAWWAIRQNGLHPRLVAEIHRTLRRETGLHPKARRAWSYILEFQANNRDLSWNYEWFDLKDRIKLDGWTPSVLREFEEITRPTLSRDLPNGISKSKPPFKKWEETSLGELATWDIAWFDKYEEEIDVPDEVLEPVFNIIQGHFIRATEMLEELEIPYIARLTCYPDREVYGEVRDSDSHFVWFLNLFERIVVNNPSIARAYSIIWSTKKYFFRKLKLYALNQVGLFHADEAANVVLSLEQECFWDYDIRRELLFLIHDRWDEFSSANKQELGERLLDGPDRMDHWSEDEYQKNKIELACYFAKWLTLNGRDMSPEQTKRMIEMTEMLPEWNDRIASNIVSEHYGVCGWVKRDESPDTLTGLPVNKVLDQAKADQQRKLGSFTDKQSFTGLVKINPRMALASLSLSAKSGEYPIEFWSDLIGEWPQETKPRLYCVFLNRLAKLPDKVAIELRHTIGEWIKFRFKDTYHFDKGLAWKIYDHLIFSLANNNSDLLVSGAGEKREGVVIIQNSRRTYEHAINGIIGKVLEGLLNLLNSLNLGINHGIPKEFKDRIESLLTVPGEGGGHAVTVISHDIYWLYFLDPEWINDKVLPWFSFENSNAEPAWNGYLCAAKIPPKELGEKLKPLILDLFPRIYEWSWDDYPAKISTQIIVELSVFGHGHPGGITTKEARDCLRNMNDENRQDAIIRLGQIGASEKDGWSIHVIPFINTVWPRERGLRTSSLVSTWVSILDDTGECFPAVLSAVRRFLVPVEGDRLHLYRFIREVNEDQPLTIKYPDAVLELLDAVVQNSAQSLPNELEQILELVIENNPSLERDRRYLRLIDLIENT